MYTKCCVPGCDSVKQTASLHKFPKNEVLAKKWLNCINNACAISGNDSFDIESIADLAKLCVCHKHFEPIFVRSSRLTRDAYPTLFSARDIASGKPFNLVCENDETTAMDSEPLHEEHNYAKPSPTTDQTTSEEILELMDPNADCYVEEVYTTPSVLDEFLTFHKPTPTPVPSSEIVVPVSEPSSKIIVPVTEHSSKIIVPVTKTSSKIIVPVTEPSSKIIVPVTKTSSKIIVPVSEPSSKIIVPVAESSSKIIVPVTKTSSKIIVQVTEPSSKIIIPVTKTSSKIIVPVTEPCSKIIVPLQVSETSSKIIVPVPEPSSNIIVQVPEPSSNIMAVSSTTKHTPSGVLKTYTRKIVPRQVPKIVTTTTSSWEFVPDEAPKTYSRKIVQHEATSSKENVVPVSSFKDIPIEVAKPSSVTSSKIQVPSSAVSTSKPQVRRTKKAAASQPQRRKNTPNNKCNKQITVEKYFDNLMSKTAPLVKTFLGMSMQFRILKKSDRNLPVEEQFEILTANMKPIAKIFLMMQIRLSKQKPEEWEFLYLEKLFCLSMMKTDTKFYSFFRQNGFIMPNIATLKEMEEYRTVKNVEKYLERKVQMIMMKSL